MILILFASGFHYNLIDIMVIATTLLTLPLIDSDVILGAEGGEVSGVRILADVQVGTYGLAPRPCYVTGAGIGAYVSVEGLSAYRQGWVAHYGFRDYAETLAVYPAGFEFLCHYITLLNT